jgi:hypothetical protein
VEVRLIMNTDLQTLGRRLVGRWTTEATHPAVPGTVVHGSSEIEWLEGERFLIIRSRSDHPDFPDSISVLGDTDGLRMHYFDSRGVHRLLELTVTEEGWATAMDRHSSASSFASPDGPFSQRMSFTFQDEDQTMSGKTKLSYDDVTWDDDLEITYRRTS